MQIEKSSIAHLAKKGQIVLKRGQVSIFLLVGMLIIFVMFLVISRGNEIYSPPGGLEAEVSSVRSYVNSCIRQGMLEAQKMGLREDVLDKQEAIVQGYVAECSDFSEWEKRGIKVERGILNVELEVSDEAFIARVNYPLALSGRNQRVSVGSFEHQISLSKEAKLEYGFTGLTEESVLVSEDSRAELTILPEALVSKDSLFLDTLGIKIVDKHFSGLENNLVVGETVYEGFPGGTEFFPHATLVISYPDSPDEEFYSIGWFNEKSKVWESLESQIDKTANKVSAKIRHFSKYAILKHCSSNNAPIVMNFGYIYKEPCYEISPDGVLSGTSKHNCPKWIIHDSPNGKPIVTPSNPEAPHAFNNGPIYAPGDAFLSGSMGTYPQFGTPRTSCVKADWDKDPSTKETYGYNSVSDISGVGSFEFSFASSGNSCISSPLKLNVLCDDECFLEFNGQKVKPDSVVDRLYTYQIQNVVLRERNFIQVKVNNSFQACSSAKVSMTIGGAGILPACQNARSDADYIYRPCSCDGKNINPVYKEEISSDPILLSMISKDTLSESEIEKLRSVIGIKQYCYDSQSLSLPELVNKKELESSYRKGFNNLVDDQQVKDCCIVSSIYPQIGEDGCESLICNRGSDSIKAYTGRKLDSNRDLIGSCSKGVKDEVSQFKAGACGIIGRKTPTKVRVEDFSREYDGRAPCVGNGGSLGFMSCPIPNDPQIITGSFGSGNPNGEHCNPATRYPLSCDISIVHWSRAIDVGGPGLSDSYPVILPTIEGQPLSWEYKTQAGSNNGLWGFVKVFSTETSEGSFLLRLTHMEFDNPHFDPGDKALSGAMAGKLFPGLDGAGIGHVHVSVEKNDQIVNNPEHDLGLCRAPRNPPT